MDGLYGIIAEKDLKKRDWASIGKGKWEVNNYFVESPSTEFGRRA